MCTLGFEFRRVNSQVLVFRHAMVIFWKGGDENQLARHSKVSSVELRYPFSYSKFLGFRLPSTLAHFFAFLISMFALTPFFRAPSKEV